MTTATSELAILPTATDLSEDQERVIRLVIARLGRPKNLVRVDAKKLWDNHFRVNVICEMGMDGSLHKLAITESYFVTLAEDGISSNPPIQPKLSA